MQAYTFMDLVNRTMLGDESFYDCAEVDPLINRQNNRIDELERALRSCQTVLARLLIERARYVGMTQDALDEANKALMVR